jgi:hypothetical protein
MIRADSQALLDAFAAVGLLAYVLALLVRRGDGPLTPRLIFLFGLLSVFYALRSLLVWTGFAALEAATFAVISLSPFAALLLCEGLLRRHAPRLLKIAIAVLSVASLASALFPRGHLTAVSWIGRGAPLILSLLALLVLIGTRDRRSLSQAENGAVRLLTFGLALAIPLVATDFPELLASPIGLSPIAALVVVLLALASSTGDARDVTIEVGLIALIGACLSFGLVQLLGLQALADRVRLFALVVSGLITVALLVRIQPFGAMGRRNGLRMRLGAADTASLGGFLADMSGEPMLKDMAILGEEDLADYQADALVGALAKRPLWSAGVLRSDQTDIGAGEREPLLDLLERAGSTHVGLLSRSPVRVGLVRLPDLLRNTEAEIDLALTFQMARLTAEARP